MDELQKFAVNLRRIRKAKGLSQEQLAELIGRSTEAISNIERGKSSPNLETVIDIRSALRIPLAELIEPLPYEASSEADRDRLIQELQAILAGVSTKHLRAIVKGARAISEL